MKILCLSRYVNQARRLQLEPGEHEVEPETAAFLFNDSPESFAQPGPKTIKIGPLKFEPKNRQIKKAARTTNLSQMEEKDSEAETGSGSTEQIA